MKKIIHLLFFGLIVQGCNNNTSEKNAAKPNDEKTTEASKSNSSSQAKGDGIIGDWSLQWETYDDNHNHLLDDEERKKGFANHYFFRFNTDGSCLINTIGSAQGAFKGHYTTKQKNGKTVIDTYLDEQGNSGFQGGYTVLSVNKDEMVLLETTGDHTFWIFKRV